MIRELLVGAAGAFGGTIGLAFRCSRRKDLLLSQPVYYTEVHFQGRMDQ